jgi:hypothetical protein
MRDPFLLVVIGVSLLALVGAVIALATSGGSYDRIGRGGLSIGDDRPAAAGAPMRQISTAERDDEIRQLLEARNARRSARGEPPLDVESELRGSRRRPPTPSWPPRCASSSRPATPAASRAVSRRWTSRPRSRSACETSSRCAVDCGAWPAFAA